MRTAMFCNLGAACPDFNAVFPRSLQERLAADSELFPHVVSRANFAELAPRLQDLDVIFATWGLWKFSPWELEALPNLKAVFYAAGSVRYFAVPLLERGIVVTSAWAANALPVAEWTLAQILLANKGYWRNASEYRECEGYGAYRGRGNYGATVSVLGAGQIGRKLIEFLKPFSLRVLCFDPFLSNKAAEVLGVEKVELPQAFARGDVVSNHLANVPATEGILNGALLRALPANATFINTGRGATVNHDDLVTVCCERSDITALLDVTSPEPVPLTHALRALPNVHLTGHIAGSIGDEVARMGQSAFQEFQAWRAGSPLRCAVTLAMLETLA